MNLFIRTDSNPEIGTGHIMRCLSIAKSAEKQGISCTFITADRSSDVLLQKNGFTPLCLNSVWNNLDLETNKMLSIINKRQIESLLIDSYFVTEKYMSALKEKTKIIYIDDLNAFVYPCDVLINYAIYWKKFDYARRYPKTTKLLLGCEYAPLREQFQNLPPKIIKEKIENILILTGGTDNYNVSLHILEAFSELPDFKNLRFKAVCGIFNNNRDKLIEFSKRFSNIEVIEPVDNIAPLMCEADLAISAAGTTLYELCACGTPTICFTLADNQIDNAIEFKANNIIRYASDARECINNLCMAILSEYYTLIDKESRSFMSLNMQKNENGFGVLNIVNQLFKI